MAELVLMPRTAVENHGPAVLTGLLTKAQGWGEMCDPAGGPTPMPLSCSGAMWCELIQCRCSLHH